MPDFHEFFYYDPSSKTCLRWKINKGCKFANDEAGSHRGRGYYRVDLEGKSYRASRVVWFLHFGEIPKGMEVDHKNRNRSDNSINNLRLATRSQNASNCIQKETNKTGVRGVHPYNKKFIGMVMHNGEIYKEVFLTIEEASQWVRAKRIELHGDFSAH